MMTKRHVTGNVDGGSSKWAMLDYIMLAALLQSSWLDP
jgi:hypothetical protein